MLLIELTGNHYEMGYQHGAKLFQYRPALLDLIASHQRKVETFPQQTVSKMLDKLKNVLSLYSPQTLDMIYGISDRFEFSRRDILSMMMASYIEDKLMPHEEKGVQEDGCTTWAYSAEKGQEERILLAKNRDYLLSHRKLQVIFRCKPDKGNEYFSVNSIGASNVFSSGMNEKGLVIADTRVPSTDVGPGLPRFSLMMHVLENFSYVSEVIDYLKSIPRMGGGNLIFTDTKGAIGSAEMGCQDLDLVQMENGFLPCTNHFNGPSMKGKNRIKDEATQKNSTWRFEEVEKNLSAKDHGMDLNRAMNLMSFHGKTCAICNHGSSNGLEETATISSVIFLPIKRGFYYCEGFPCSMSYDWISF